MAVLEIVSPLAGSVVAIAVEPGASVARGAVVAVVESMKMEHEVHAGAGGVVHAVRARVGDVVEAGATLVVLRVEATVEADFADRPLLAQAAHEPLRADLLELRAREALLADGSRPEAVARRHVLGLRTARENVADLCDEGSFIEYGALAYAAQRARRELDDLLRNTPADGMVTGIGSVNGTTFGASARAPWSWPTTPPCLPAPRACATTRRPIACSRSPLSSDCRSCCSPKAAAVGRATSTCRWSPACMSPTFAQLRALERARAADRHRRGPVLRGQRRAARLLRRRHRDRNSSIGMGGPAMVEGGGLGAFAPEEIGPSEMQSRAGVIDVLVADEAEAVAVASSYLAFFQGRPAARRAPIDRAAHDHAAEPPARVRNPQPSSRRSSTRDSVLELRAGFGAGIVTALARIEGRPVGMLANNPPTSAARSTPTPPTRRRASCSCATPSRCRSSR